jgi:hypothetical protein
MTYDDGCQISVRLDYNITFAASKRPLDESPKCLSVEKMYKKDTYSNICDYSEVFIFKQFNWLYAV